jgi:GNAT superfamily N-acetyltransferase
VIRVATPADAAAITALQYGGWRTAYRGLMPDEILDNLDDEERRAKWHDRIADGARMLVHDEDGTLTGFAYGGPTRDDDRTGYGEVYALYVSQDRWGAGVGAKLLDTAVDDLRDRGFTQFVLWVLTGNARARRFYEKQGWVHDGTDKESPWAAWESRYELRGSGA